MGEGAFGCVYLARDTELNRLVALKIPHVGPFASPEELDQFLQEARTAAQLDHEGIVTIYDVFRDGEQVVIVQQYVEGQDLRSYLATSGTAPGRSVCTNSTRYYRSGECCASTWVCPS